MDLFTYLMAKNNQNTQRDLFSYLLGKGSGGGGTYTTYTGTSLNISNSIKAKIKNFMLNSTELTQDGTPTPSNPIDVNVIKGDNTITLSNSDDTEEQNYSINLNSKNLFNPNYYLNQTFSIGTYKYTLSDVVGNRTLYFKGTLKEGKTKLNGLYVSLTTSGGDPNQGTSCYAIRSGNASSSQYITADFTGTNNLYLSFYPTTYTWEQIDEVYDFWISTDDINYEPYYNIDYCKIGDYRDQIFKNTINSPYYDNTLIENEWYLKKNIGKYVFTGNENITIQTTTATKRNFIVSAVNDTIYQTTNVNEIPNVRTTKFAAVKPSATWVAGQMSTGTNTKSIYLITEPTVEIADLKTIITNEPLYYGLATPSYIHISQEDYPTLKAQLDNLYNNAESYTGTTNITQTNEDLPFNISVDVKVS